MKKKIVALLLVLCVVFAFSACAPKMTLEQYAAVVYEKTLKEPGMDEVLAEMDFQVIAESETLTYEYTYKYLSLAYLEAEGIELAKEFEEMDLSNLKAVMGNVLKEMRSQTDVKNPVVRVEYKTSDGELIYSTDFK